MDYEETVVSREPFEARFTFTVDGDAITLTVGDDLSVVDVSEGRARPNRALTGPPGTPRRRRTSERARPGRAGPGGSTDKCVPATGRAVRVTLLGTGQLHPAERVQCGTLIEDVPVLVDCGAGVYQRLYESAVGVDDLEHVLLTHLHQDHVNDLVPLVGAKRHVDSRPLPDGPGRRDTDTGPSRLTVHGPPGTERFVELVTGAHLKPRDPEDDPVEFPLRAGGVHLSVEEVTPGSSFAVERRSINTLPTKHASGEDASMAYRFDDELVVSGDTAAIESMAEFADGVAVLVHECTFLHGEGNTGHTTPRDLARILSGADVDELYLTHLPEHTPEERRATIETIREGFDGNVTVPRDMERLSTRTS